MESVIRLRRSPLREDAGAAASYEESTLKRLSADFWPIPG
jgi:hypothetical protein